MNRISWCWTTAVGIIEDVICEAEKIKILVYMLNLFLTIFVSFQQKSWHHQGATKMIIQTIGLTQRLQFLLIKAHTKQLSNAELKESHVHNTETLPQSNQAQRKSSFGMPVLQTKQLLQMHLKLQFPKPKHHFLSQMTTQFL